MASAADSAATVASQAECEVDGERSPTSGHLPIFDAFDDLGLTGRDLAEIAQVTAPTISKWRKAKARIGGEQIAFLTLVLAHLLDEADNVSAMHAELGTSPREQTGLKGLQSGHIDAARAQLVYQDVLNRDLPASDVRAGAQRFRTWWSSGEAQKLQDRHFQPPLSSDVLEVLKRIRKKNA